MAALPDVMYLPRLHWKFICFAILQFAYGSSANNVFARRQSTTACMSAAQKGTLDRSAVNVSIVHRAWVSHTIVTSMVEIILHELLLYNVVVVDGTAGGDQSRYAEDMSAAVHLYDIEMEAWWPTKNLVEDMGFLGYSGRSGLYTFGSMQNRSHNPNEPPYVTYYKMYKNFTRCANLGYLSFHDSTLKVFLGNAFPICNKAKHSWCGSGLFEGYWAAPRCRASPHECLEVFMASPDFDRGYFEQLTRTLVLPVAHGYYGANLRQKILSLQGAAKTPTFYAWEPDPFLVGMKAARIQFPDHTLNCDRGNNHDPNSGIVGCDYAWKELKKAAFLQLRNLAPEAYYVVQRYQITIAQLNLMIASTVAAGGSKTPYEAACDFLQNNPALISDFAPDCMIRPNPFPKMGDLVFDNITLQCRQSIIFPLAEQPPKCLPIPQGPVDRRSTIISVAIRGWASHILVSLILVILLEDLLGYTVHVFNASQGSQVRCPAEIAAGIYDIDAEFWHKSSANYATHVRPGGVLDAGQIGYYGRSGLWVLDRMLTTNEFTTYWKTYRNATYAANLGFLTFNDSQGRPLGQLKEFLGNQFPVCNQSLVGWCASNVMTGYWPSPQCSAHPEACLEIFMKSPTYDEGYFEQLTGTLGIPAIHGYYGNDFKRRLMTLKYHTPTPIFYGHEPDLLLKQMNASRISFPSHYRDCDSQNTKNPNTGIIGCDYQEKSLVKLCSTTVEQAREAYYLFKELKIFHAELDRMLSSLAGEQYNGVNISNISETDIACDFLRNRPPQWIQNVAPKEIVTPIPLANLQVGDTWFDSRMLAIVNVYCPPNQTLQISLQAQNWSCRSCPPGFEPNVKQTACVDIITPQSEANDNDYASIIVSLAIGISACGICVAIRFRRNVLLDNPVNPDTPTGAWVSSWVGPHLQKRLVVGQSARQSSHTQSMGVSSTQSTGSNGSAQQIARGILKNRNMANIWTSKRRPNGSLPKRGKFWKKKMSSAVRVKAWLVNATPFTVRLQDQITHRHRDMENWTVMKTKRFDLSWSLTIEVEAPDQYVDSEEALTFDIADMNWQVDSDSDDQLKRIQYECPVLRLEMPAASDGSRMGHLKLVRGPKSLLLVYWSPPTEMRGMPLHEFEKFLEKCINHKAPWTCRGEGLEAEKDTGLLARLGDSVARLPDSVNQSINNLCKFAGDASRNMYDACENMIKTEVAIKDTSYAELFTEYGVPIMFASHVWSVPAEKTLQMVRNLDLGSAPQDEAEEDRLCCATPKSSKSLATWRIWFCTACNNQSRVQDELGSDVSQSPFARVIQSQQCLKVVLFSPLDALERKWCNYEFSIAKNANKQVLLATEDGVVQAGRVAPRALHELARKARVFKCQNATCFSAADEALIDGAIQRMGGYDELNDDLKKVIFDAITDAHKWTGLALASFSWASETSHWDADVAKPEAQHDADARQNMGRAVPIITENFDGRLSNDGMPAPPAKIGEESPEGALQRETTLDKKLILL